MGRDISNRRQSSESEGVSERIQPPSKRLRATALQRLGGPGTPTSIGSGRGKKGGRLALETGCRLAIRRPDSTCPKSPIEARMLQMMPVTGQTLCVCLRPLKHLRGPSVSRCLGRPLRNETCCPVPHDLQNWSQTFAWSAHRSSRAKSGLRTSMASPHNEGAASEESLGLHSGDPHEETPLRIPATREVPPSVPRGLLQKEPQRELQVLPVDGARRRDEVL